MAPANLLLRTAPLAFSLFLILYLSAPEAVAQRITLEPVTRSGYGVIALKRPRPNVLTATAEIDGRKISLLVDTGWTGEGIGLFDTPPAATADRVTIGNVQLAKVPLTTIKQQARGRLSERVTGARGVIGAGFLRTCSAIVDLQNLRLYMRPPGKGQRAVIGQALEGAGMAAVPFEQGASGCTVPVEVNQFAGRMQLDTGAYHATADVRVASNIGARPFVTRAGHTRPDEFEHVTRMDRRRAEVAPLVEKAPMTPLQSFKIGGVPVHAPDIRLRKLDLYSASAGKVIGELGMDILGPNGAIIDFGERKLYVVRRITSS